MRRRLILAAVLASVVLAAATAISAAPKPFPGPQLAAAADAAKAQRAALLTPEQLVAMTDEVARDVEALRGWTFKQPIKKELTTVEQMRQYLEQQADKELPSGKLQVTQAFLRTIGFIPPTGDLRGLWMTLLENQVAGFYDTKTKTMHLIARGALPSFVERIMLAHELTHALDDQYTDLEAFVKAKKEDTEDAGLTAQSVVEGSATALMIQYMARSLMAGRGDLQSMQDYAKQEAERSKVFEQVPPYFSAMLGSYVCGTGFLARGPIAQLALAPDDKAVGEALLAARKNPPASTEQILHPEKYWNPQTRDEPVVVDDAAATNWLARPGRWIVHADTVGEMLLAILTSATRSSTNSQAAQMASAAWTNAAAEGWGGDRFYLLASGESQAAARAGLQNLQGVWVTAWDTPKDREEFMAALPKSSVAPGAVAEPIGAYVAVVYFGIDQAERTALTEKLRSNALRMTKDGRAWAK